MPGILRAGDEPFPTFNNVAVAFRVALVSIIEGSEPEPDAARSSRRRSGLFPATMGASQRSFWAGVATFSSTIMLPSSGAAEWNTTGPKIERFIAS